MQLIFYGTPGTGKSFTIDNMTDDNNAVRTTFHPDSDYATFVGAYKPTMQPMPIHAFVGTTVYHANNADNVIFVSLRIVIPSQQTGSSVTPEFADTERESVSSYMYTLTGTHLHINNIAY